jgi:hypothetical protein
MRDPLIFARVPVRQLTQFGQDPLIRNQVVGVRKAAEIGISDGLPSFAGYPMGTRPISKGAEPVKV